MSTYIAIADYWDDVNQQFISKHSTYGSALSYIENIACAKDVVDTVSQSGIYRVEGEIDDDVSFAVADTVGGERVGALLAYHKGKQFNIDATLVFSLNRYEDDEGNGVVVNMTRPKGARALLA